MINRRRFMLLSAAVLAAPAHATTRHDWTGRALGAQTRLTLAGATDRQARHIFARVTAVLAEVEAQFSLYRDSGLTRLNRDGWLAYPGQSMLDLFALAGRVHLATAGVFDPTIQPLWLATAKGGDILAARAALGWDRLRISPEEIRLQPGMALTFNGIAQGYAADRIAALMRDEGLGNVLIDMGEVHALGRRPDGAPWRVAVAGQAVGRQQIAHQFPDPALHPVADDRVADLLGGGNADADLLATIGAGAALQQETAGALPPPLR